MKKQLQWFMVVCGILLILIHGGPARGGTGDIAIGGKVGTLGLGAEMTVGLLPHLNARVGVNGFSYTYDVLIDDIDYEFDLSLLSGTLLMDWHFLKSAFRLSAGLVLNGNNVDLKARTDDAIFIVDDVAYSRDDVGELDGTIDFNTISPYLGIGWGNAVDENKNLCFFIDLGVLFQGAPKADLSATGPISSDPEFRRHLQNEEEEIEEETDGFKLYPVIAIGIAYKF